MMKNTWCLVALAAALACWGARAEEAPSPRLSQAEQRALYTRSQAVATEMGECLKGKKENSPASPTSPGAAENLDLPTPDSLPDGVWFDNKTGLMWQMCPSGQAYLKDTQSCDGSVHLRPYGRAVKVAYKSKLGGFRDWRVPTHADWLAFKRNALRPVAAGGNQKLNVPPAYLAPGVPFPDVFWTSEGLVFSKTRYVSKACFPEVSMIGSCGSSYTVAGKDRLFGTGNYGEGWVAATLFVRDGKPNEVWDEALLREGIDTAAAP